LVRSRPFVEGQPRTLAQGDVLWLALKSGHGNVDFLAVCTRAEKDVVLQTLGLKETSERDELPAESPITGAALASGWYVVVFDRYGHELVNDDVLSRI